MVGRNLWFISMLAAVLGGSQALAQTFQDPPPGTRVEVRPDDLPRPHATPSVGNQAEPVARRDGRLPRVPDGFAVNIFADRLAHARWLTVAPNGDVFLAEPRSGHIRVLRDADGDGRAEINQVFLDGLRRPHGMALRDNAFYVADVNAVWRVPYTPGELKASAKPQQVTAKGALGDSGGHWTRNIAFAPDGSKFYVAIGSASNMAEEKSPRATVQEFSADGKNQRTFASGLRNPVGIAFYPGTNDLYTVVNERDGQGDELVPDYLTRLKDGGFYGWPYSYIGSHPQPEFAGKRPDLVKQAIVPDLLFRAHTAALGLVFYTADQFPADYKGDAFVALHGSWNAKQPRGYNVVRVPFENGKPAGHYEVFMSGFWVDGADPAQVIGRPVGLAVARDGSLLVADDSANVVWRVSRKR
jgi:glucose/arabinose dehydrogenase